MITEIGCNQCGTTIKAADAKRSGWRTIRPYASSHTAASEHELHVCPKCKASFAHDYATTTTIEGSFAKLYDTDLTTEGPPDSVCLDKHNGRASATIMIFGTEFVVRGFRLSNADEMIAADPEYQPKVAAILDLADWDGGCQTTSIPIRGDSDDQSDYVLCLVPSCRC
jgi:hypothetical protein